MRDKKQKGKERWTRKGLGAEQTWKVRPSLMGPGMEAAQGPWFFPNSGVSGVGLDPEAQDTVKGLPQNLTLGSDQTLHYVSGVVRVDFSL